MELLKRLVVEEEGQGLVEYTLIVLLVALVFWVAVKGTNADQALSSAWTSIVGCLNSGTGCWLLKLRIVLLCSGFGGKKRPILAPKAEAIGK